MRCHCDLGIENLALRQQLAFLKHRHSRPWLTDADRVFWVVLSQIWAGWRFAPFVQKIGRLKGATIKWEGHWSRSRWHAKDFAVKAGLGYVRDIQII